MLSPFRITKYLIPGVNVITVNKSVGIRINLLCLTGVTKGGGLVAAFIRVPPPSLCARKTLLLNILQKHLICGPF